MKAKLLAVFFFGFIFTALAQEIGTAPPDSLVERKTKWSIFPVVYYTPETQFAFGTKLIHVRQAKGSYPTDRPTVYSPTLIYTTQKQIITSFSADVWRAHNIHHLHSALEYNDYPYFFFGIGNDAPEAAEEDYTSRTINFYGQYERRIFHKAYLGIRYEFKREILPEIEPEGILAKKEILGSEGTTASGLGPVLVVDSRDNLFTPSRGHYHQASAIFFQKFLGSETNFSRYRFDLRKYMSGLGPGILAVQGLFTFTTGNAPFQFLAPIGGVNVMRGLLEGRFRDEDAIVGQIDYRFPIAGRIGGAVFGGAGQVSQRINDFTFNEFHLAGGGGLRYRLNKEGMIVRGDLAFSQEGMYVYFAFSEAF